MSYLASIIGRANGTASMLQPRLPSRYEADARPFAAAPAEVHAERDAMPAPATEAPVAAHADAPAAAHAPAMPVAGETRHVVEIQQTNAPAPPPRTIVQTERVVEHHSERIEETRERMAAAPPPAASSAVESRSTPRSPAGEAAPAETHEERREAPPLRALLLPAPPPRRIVMQPVRVTATAEPQRDETGAAPTIRVTIGRVDVRAVPSAAPAAKPHSARNPFTLDDYVRLRKDRR
jgi:hypothetical protein